MKKKELIFLFTDILLIFLSFLFFIWIKPASKRFYLPTYIVPFVYFIVVWLISSLLFRKFKLSNRSNFTQHSRPVVLSNVFAICVLLILMYAFNFFAYSRLIVYGTILTATAIELLFAMMLSFVSKTREEFEQVFEKSDVYKTVQFKEEIKVPKNENEERLFKAREKSLSEKLSKKAVLFISTYLNLCDDKVFLTNVDNLFPILNLPYNDYNGILNIHRMNNYRYINKFLEAVNEKLIEGGIFAGRIETKELRKRRIYENLFFGLRELIYTFDYIFNRLFPKIPVLMKVYFFITKGKNRVISRAECFGRLYSCGFWVVNDCYCDNYLYFIAQKVKEPIYDQNPTYGPFIKLKRIGKGGKIIKVYKFRTMHPYSEYLQAYVHFHHQLDEGGKFKDDFRITMLGRIMRKLWLDELPMLYNMLKGDLKIVGVRPLSQHYFNLYDKNIQEKRILVKPGLIPPFYYDMPKTLEEIQASEERYIDAYLKKPFRTDVRYFFGALKNILFKGARSN